MTERPLDVVLQIAERHFTDLHQHRARFNLGPIEDVVDQGEKIIAGSVNCPGTFHLLFGEVFVPVFGKLV